MGERFRVFSSFKFIGVVMNCRGADPYIFFDPKSEYYYQHTLSFPTFTFVDKSIIDKFILAIKKIDENRKS